MTSTNTDASVAMTATDTPRVLILGLGNILLQDEGVGIRVLERLDAEYEWPVHSTLLDGGVMGLELLPYLESADAVLLLDAVHTGEPPGSIVRLEGNEIPAVVALKMSMHQVGLQETLAMCQFRGTLPERLVLLGVVPARLDLGLDLSPQVAAQVTTLVQAAVSELRGWGILGSKHKQLSPDAQAWDVG
jgi:hydrogenase maturation protease